MVRGLPYPGSEDHLYHRYTNEHVADVNQAGTFLPPRLPSIAASEAAIAALRDNNGDASVEFAMMVFVGGQVRCLTSDGLRHVKSLLFPESLREAFVQGLRGLPRSDIPGPYSRSGRRSSHDYYSSDSSGTHPSRRNPRQLQDNFDSEETSFGTKRRRPCLDVEEDDTPTPALVVKTMSLVIGDNVQMRKYWEQKFRDLQQTVCKILGKAFVKTLEPKKQTNHPYTGGAEKAPAWWPSLPKSDQKGAARDGVRHKEPDHLLKKERITLLTEILEVITDRKHLNRPEVTRGVSIRDLERQANEVMTVFYNDSKINDQVKEKKRGILQELFRVAKRRESFKDGGLDGTATVTIKVGDSEFSDDEPDEGIEDDDDYSPGMPTPDSFSSHHNQTSRQSDAEYPLPMHSRFVPMEEPRYEGMHPPMQQQQSFVQTSYPHPEDPNRRPSPWSPSFSGPGTQFGWTSPQNHMLAPNSINFNGFTAHQQPQNNSFPPPTGFHLPQLPPPGQPQTMPRPVHQQQFDSERQQHYQEFIHDPIAYHGSDVQQMKAEHVLSHPQ